MTKTMFTLQILHGGKLVQGDHVTYVNGEESISTVDSDLMSYFELMYIMKDIGYPNNPLVYYKLPNSDMNIGLVTLTSNTEIVNMFNVHAGRTLIEIFVHTPDFVNGKVVTNEIRNEVEDDGIFMNEVTIPNGLVDVFSDFDSEWKPYDDVQIDSDKEGLSGMEESSTGGEEEIDKDGGIIDIGDKELGDNDVVVKKERWVILILVVKRRVIMIEVMDNIAKLSH
ncbi:hypothetical protein Acr_17g0006860 [Actinidia rufa]|uniref:PB1-like domain-containing protein n=1 Tax=Actinidia rufa TaxID=165716 RepID=A0A7J0G2V5_9ERIC|nr:hypothetical protein Acr_17g0006860 [Actinidia rufa]